MTSTAVPAEVESGSWWDGIRHRELTHYPDPAARNFYLGLTVLVTIALYYMAYCGGSVSILQIVALNMSFHFLIWVIAVGNVLGALGALFAGVSDRIGRVPVILVGMTVASLLTLFALPASPNRWVFAVLAFLVGNIEGIVLVATPALIRDFSPQADRATAMGAWSLGPVIGSLIVSVVGTLTIHGTPPADFWGHEYVLAGIAGLVVSAIAILCLRELAPQLRDQILVSQQDRVLAELQAKGIDVDQALRKPFRQMLKADIIISGFAVSILLLAYYTAIGLGTILFQIVFGFSLHQANSLGNWNWGVNAVAVVGIGIVSDRLKVRKPLMVIGAVIGAVGLALYLSTFGHNPSYLEVALIISVVSFGLGVAYTPWMASFSETCEDHNPALTATGLAVWGLTIRVVVFFMLIVLPLVITTVTPLVNFAVRTSPYTSALVFAGQHPALIAEVENPTNVSELGMLVALERSDPAQMDAVRAGSSDLATLVQFAPEAQAVAAHPTLYTQLLTNPTDASLQTQAKRLSGDQVVNTLLANEAQLVPALIWAKSNGPVLTFALAHTAVLGWAASHAQLLAQVSQYQPELTLLRSTPPSILAYATANSATVTKDQRLIPGQARTWYWVCFGGAVLFIAGVPLLRGRWSPRRAQADLDAHEAEVEVRLAELGAGA